MKSPDLARLYLGRCMPPNGRESNAIALRRAMAEARGAAVVLADSPTLRELLCISKKTLAWAEFCCRRLPDDVSWSQRVAMYQRLVRMATRAGTGHA